jgi:hypothetical protein
MKLATKNPHRRSNVVMASWDNRDDTFSRNSELDSTKATLT